MSDAVQEKKTRKVRPSKWYIVADAGQQRINVPGLGDTVCDVKAVISGPFGSINEAKADLAGKVKDGCKLYIHKEQGSYECKAQTSVKLVQLD